MTFYDMILIVAVGSSSWWCGHVLLLCLPSMCSMMVWQMYCMCSSMEQPGGHLWLLEDADAEEDGPLLHRQKLDPSISRLHFTHRNEESQNFRVCNLENWMLVSSAEKQMKNVRIFLQCNS